MAARLNVPADFILPKQASASSMSTELLPPSSFEVPSVADPWKRLASATTEILQLKAENQKLKEVKEVRIPAGEEIKARVDVHQGPPSFPPGAASFQREISHYDEILNRQAAEIDSLRKKLYTQETDSQKVVAKLESQSVVKNAENNQQIATLQTELDNLKSKHVHEKRHLQEENEKLVAELTCKLVKVEERLESCTDQHQHEERVLHEKLSCTQQELEQTRADMDSKLREKENVIRKQEEHVSQMKQYLGASEHAAKSTAMWREEVESLKLQLHEVVKDRSAAHEQLQLLGIRLQSKTSILAAQEQALTQGKEDPVDKTRLSLLTRWREKVYSLLVQMKSTEISHKQEVHQLKLQLMNKERDLESSKNETNVLQNSLSDCEAQLRMEENRVKSLQVALTDAQEMALSLDDQVRESVAHLTHLAQFTYSLHKERNCLENRLHETLAKLKAYDQRIAFASGRVEMLQGQFARKEAMMKLKLQEELDEKPTRDSKVTLQEQKPQVSQYQQLEEELMRVTDERDQLVCQMKQDAQLLHSRVSDARKQYADEVKQLQNRLTELHSVVDEKTQKCSSLSKSVEETHVELAEAQETIETLKTDLARQQLQADKVAEETRSKHEAQQTEQLAEMEKQLNTARREHTKAVVSLRQTERQAGREKERLQEQLKAVEGQHRIQQEQIQTRHRAMEKDRNLLMATLRQEGLIGKYQTQRPVPVTGRLGEEDEKRGEDHVLGSQTEAAAASEEPLHTVIDDLKSLTVAVMDDEVGNDTDES